jgi:hypothetical protein
MVQQWHFTDVTVAVIFSEVRLGWCYFFVTAVLQLSLRLYCSV